MVPNKIGGATTGMNPPCVARKSTRGWDVVYLDGTWQQPGDLNDYLQVGMLSRVGAALYANLQRADVIVLTDKQRPVDYLLMVGEYLVWLKREDWVRVLTYWSDLHPSRELIPVKESVFRGWNPPDKRTPVFKFEKGHPAAVKLRALLFRDETL